MLPSKSKRLRHAERPKLGRGKQTGATGRLRLDEVLTLPGGTHPPVFDDQLMLIRLWLVMLRFSHKVIFRQSMKIAQERLNKSLLESLCSPKLEDKDHPANPEPIFSVASDLLLKLTAV
jgi:hypothetical protein